MGAVARLLTPDTCATHCPVAGVSDVLGAILSLHHVTATCRVLCKDYLLELSQFSGVGQILITITQTRK